MRPMRPSGFQWSALLFAQILTDEQHRAFLSTLSRAVEACSPPSITHAKHRIFCGASAPVLSWISFFLAFRYAKAYVHVNE